MSLQTYTIERHDANDVVLDRVVIKEGNEIDGLAEAKRIGRGCAYFLVRGKRSAIIYDSRDEA